MESGVHRIIWDFFNEIGAVKFLGSDEVGGVQDKAGVLSTYHRVPVVRATIGRRDMVVFLVDGDFRTLCHQFEWQHKSDSHQQ